MQASRLFCLDFQVFCRCGRQLLVAWAWLALASSYAQAPAPAASNITGPATTGAEAPAVAPPPAPAAAPASRAASSRAPLTAKANGKQSTKPVWRELKPAEQVALTPLANTWDAMSVAQKRKWLALSHNYPKLSPDEQVKLHSRMSEWAALSPQQRTEARLNFGATQQLSADDKKAKWEAYQALSPEEKSKLASRAAKAPAAAAAVKPVPANKLATIPKPKLSDKPGKTLLPAAQPVPAVTLPVSNLPASAPAR